MQVNVLYFATLRDLAGAKQEQLTLPEAATVADLKAALAQRSQRLAQAMDSVLISINREFAFPEERLSEGDEIGVFPPVSGGAPSPPTVLRVSPDELDLDALTAEITRETTGAVCLFTGVVRARTAELRTEFLEYEAYEPMALAKLKQVADEIREQWPQVEGIAIVQRLGHLDTGTPTVVIACSAGHRDDGVFEAARYGIDRLKQIVPIWKKEVGTRGELWVEGGYRPTAEDKDG